MPSPRLRFAAAGAAALAVLPLAARADEVPLTGRQLTSPLPESAPIEELRLDDLLGTPIASASKLSQLSSAAPALVSSVPREQLQAFGWNSLNDVLFSLPGFFPSRDFERRTVGARGQFEPWNNNHLLLLVDGIPFNDNETGGAYTWDITPLWFSKSVEVLRGPGSALYGSSAMNGVVTLHALSPSDLGPSHVRARARVGNAGTQAYDAVGGMDGTRAEAVLGFSFQTTDGEQYLSADGSGRLNERGLPAEFLVKDHRQSRYAYARIAGKGAWEGLSLQFHDQAWSYDTGLGWFLEIPDTPEIMREARHIAALSYAPPAEEGKVHGEYVLRLQRHDLLHHMRFLPNGANYYGTDYPAGVTETVLTHVDDVFGRAQWDVGVGEKGRVLGGVEYTAFLYSGDEAHTANADLPAGTPLDGEKPLGPYYEYVLNHPVHTLAAYAQYTSGRVLGDLLEVTAGARFDDSFFTYDDVAAERKPLKSKQYTAFSPRLGLVAFPASDVSVKLLAGRAFRAPAAVELFGANTWALASNIAALKPEQVTSVELAADWKLSKELAVRVNSFYLNFENLIAYGTNNLLLNVYSHDIAGAEAEALFDTDVGGGRLSGFASWSWSHLVSETILDPTYAQADGITWAPAHNGKAGASWAKDRFQASAQVYVQGPAARRTSDLGAGNRPDALGPWASVNGLVSWRAFDGLRLGLQSTNVLGTIAPIMKGGAYPFDYRLDTRRVMLFAELEP